MKNKNILESLFQVKDNNITLKEQLLVDCKTFGPMPKPKQLCITKYIPIKDRDGYIPPKKRKSRYSRSWKRVQAELEGRPNIQLLTTRDEYRGLTQKGKFFCTICNEQYEQLFNNFVHQHCGCPGCWSNKIISNDETKVGDFIETFYPYEIIRNCRDLIWNIETGRFVEIDLYLYDIRMGIEFQGTHWHSPLYYPEVCKKDIYKVVEFEKYGGVLRQIHEERWMENEPYIKVELKEEILQRVKEFKLYNELGLFYEIYGYNKKFDEGRDLKNRSYMEIDGVKTYTPVMVTKKVMNDFFASNI